MDHEAHHLDNNEGERMKKRICIGIAALLTLSMEAGFTQGAFQNLDFESAQIIPIPNSPYYPYGVATKDALPGWTAYQGGGVVSAIVYNSLALGAAAVSIHDTSSAYAISFGG